MLSSSLRSSAFVGGNCAVLPYTDIQTGGNHYGKIRRSDLAPQEPPAAPHAAFTVRTTIQTLPRLHLLAPEKKRGSLAYTLAMLFFGVVFWSVLSCLSNSCG